MIRALLGSFALLVSCNTAPTEEEYDLTRGGRIDVFFNDPGTDATNIWTSDAIDVMIGLIDSTEVSLEVAVMGLSYDPVWEAMIRAYDRGVNVRVVGDAGHMYNDGYEALFERHIPFVTGNLNHIMHHKFMVSDDRFLFCGTANWTPTDLERNANNFVLVDSPSVAKDFQDEFEQMFAGSFGTNKIQIDNGRTYTVDDTQVEVWFSPNEDAMGRILELVDAAQESIHFTIFAFTKDQLGSSIIRKMEEFEVANAAAGLDGSDPFAGKNIAGVIDQSQLHSNGQYHEVYRLLSSGVEMRMDGNDNSMQPGDYQAGGGRLHSKTMVIDKDGENPIVITGSFNWSASATVANDEYLMVMHGARVAALYDEYFDYLWDSGRTMGGDRVGTDLDGHTLAPGDVIINEVLWYGMNHQDQDGFDEFVELRNTTDKTIDLELWQLNNPDDVVVGLPPGSIIEPYGLFTILDHTLEPYQDGAPQDEVSAFKNGNLVVNSYNDNRQSRLYIKDGSFELILRDPAGNDIDFAGDGGPAFSGGPMLGANGKDTAITDLGYDIAQSMERIANPVDGTLGSDWYANTLSVGGENVNVNFEDEVRASPGQENSTP